MLLREAIQQPDIAPDLQKYYGGDVSKLDQAAKSGDIRAQQLKNKIFSSMNNTTPIATPTSQPNASILARTNLDFSTKTTTPSNIPSGDILEISAISSNGSTPIANNPTTRIPAQENIQQSMNQTPSVNAGTSDIEKARLAMEKAQQGYLGEAKSGLGFEEALREAIMKKANYLQDYYNQKGEIVSGLRTVDSDIRSKYGDKLDPIALRQVAEQARGALEERLVKTEGLIKEKRGYLDDIIKAGVKAEEDKIKYAKEEYDAAKESYNNLKSSRKELVSFMTQNFEGPEVDALKQEMLNELGYKSTENLIASDLSSIVKAIGAHENAGQGYQALGDRNHYTKSGVWDPALGYYQILRSNWINWSKAAGIDPQYQNPDQFINKATGKVSIPEDIQDKVAAYQLGVYFTKYGGDVNKIIQAWNPGAGQAYVDKVKANLFTGLTPKAKTETERQLKDRIMSSIKQIVARKGTRKEIEDMIWDANVDPNTAPYKSYLDQQFGVKAPTDLQKKASDIVEMIKNGDTKYVSKNAVKWSAVPEQYRDRVKALLEMEKSATTKLPWYAR